MKLKYILLQLFFCTIHFYSFSQQKDTSKLNKAVDTTIEQSTFNSVSTKVVKSDAANENTKIMSDFALNLADRLFTEQIKPKVKISRSNIENERIYKSSSQSESLERNKENNFGDLTLNLSKMAQNFNVDLLTPSLKAVAKIPLKKERNFLTISCSAGFENNLSRIIIDKNLSSEYSIGINYTHYFTNDKSENKTTLHGINILNNNVFSKKSFYDSTYKITDSIKGKVFDKLNTECSISINYTLIRFFNSEKTDADEKNVRMYFTAGPYLSFGNIRTKDLDLQNMNVVKIDSSYSPIKKIDTSEESKTAYFKDQYHVGARFGLQAELFLIGDKNIGINIGFTVLSKIFGGKNQAPTSAIVKFKIGPIINAQKIGDDKVMVSIIPFFEYSYYKNKDIRLYEKKYNFGFLIGAPFNFPSKETIEKRAVKKSINRYFYDNLVK